MVRIGTILLQAFLFSILTLPNSYPIFALEGQTLVFGRIHDDPVRSIRDRQEFVDYLAQKLAPLGITGGKILVVDKIHQLTQALKEGKVDLFHDSVAPTMVLSKRTGSIPILRQWKYGTAEYEGIIVVKKSSGINSLADLKGKVIAFEEPHSTSASILPRMLLEERKMKLVPLKSPGPVKPDAVGYIYGADGGSLNVLITEGADAATTISRELDRLKPEIRESLKVVLKDLDEKMVKEIKNILTAMDKTSEGQGVLKRQQNTNKFDEIPPKSVEQLKKIEKFVFSSLGKEVDSW
jgi:phosphonate transport system substrate-binding protein